MILQEFSMSVGRLETQHPLKHMIALRTRELFSCVCKLRVYKYVYIYVCSCTYDWNMLPTMKKIFLNIIQVCHAVFDLMLKDGHLQQKDLALFSLLNFNFFNINARNDNETASDQTVPDQNIFQTM